VDIFGGAVKNIDLSLAEEACALVTGARQRTYDHPAHNFARIAALWEVVLGQPVTPKQVGLCMVMVKLAREVHAPQRDNIVDAIGYLLTTEASQ